jgi:hypothetical protein
VTGALISLVLILFIGRLAMLASASRQVDG